MACLQALRYQRPISILQQLATYYVRQDEHLGTYDDQIHSHSDVEISKLALCCIFTAWLRPWKEMDQRVRTKLISIFIVHGCRILIGKFWVLQVAVRVEFVSVLEDLLVLVHGPNFHENGTALRNQALAIRIIYPEKNV